MLRPPNQFQPIVRDGHTPIGKVANVNISKRFILDDDIVFNAHHAEKCTQYHAYFYILRINLSILYKSFTRFIALLMGILK